MSAKKLRQAFNVWRAEGRSLVLATVFETAGSTYSKTGAQMLITGDGRFQGMLSGGCLEGDLAERAAAVVDSGVPQAVTYDLRMNDEALWGLGVGCDGLMRIFLQELRPAANYEPFTSMARAYAGDTEETAITVLQSGVASLPAGATLVTVDGEIAWTDIDAQFHDALMRPDAMTAIETVAIGGDEISVLTCRLEPPPKVLVLGAGLDAEPVLRFADELGWRVTITDHRPAYIERGDFALAENVRCVPAADIGRELDLDEFAAAIVMSHHLESDRTYLAQLAGSSIAYIGLLGPPDRRRRLLAEAGAAAEKLQGRIHGPAGLDIGARGPAPIALSIVAEMHQFLNLRQAC
jgi:xanthine/CO dehydrogenase XdhC/CoxF family maturation factor